MNGYQILGTILRISIDFSVGLIRVCYWLLMWTMFFPLAIWRGHRLPRPRSRYRRTVWR